MNTQVNQIDSKQFAELAEKENHVILDVRTQNEFLSGKIGNAQNIDIMSGDFTSKIEQLPKDKSYLVYCAGGNRSNSAASFMAQKGFGSVYNLMGGIMSWPYETK